jgi:hypothetical protein
LLQQNWVGYSIADNWGSLWLRASAGLCGLNQEFSSVLPERKEDSVSFTFFLDPSKEGPWVQTNIIGDYYMRVAIDLIPINNGEIIMKEYNNEGIESDATEEITNPLFMSRCLFYPLRQCESL